MQHREFYQSDNSGNRVCHPEVANPVAASGISFAMATAGNDYTQTVVGGQQYICTALTGMVLLSITGVTSTAANIEWAIPANTTRIIKIPQGVTTLYGEPSANTTTLYMAKLAS
jgi:hypothetical protein